MVRFGSGNCSTEVTSCTLQKKIETKKTLVGVNVKDIKHKKRTFRIGSLSIRFHVEVVFHQGGSQ